MSEGPWLALDLQGLGGPSRTGRPLKDWAAEKMGYPNELSEMALAHTIGSAVEAAYRRGDMFDPRRRLMADWAGFLGEWG
jgi:hypothetical protein